MSEEFVLYASFTTDSKETMELLKKVEQCFDDENYDYFLEVSSDSKIDFLSESLMKTVGSTSSPHSYNLDDYHGNFIQDFKGVSEEIYPQMTIEGEEEIEIFVEGNDNASDDFCAFFMSFLFALDLSKLSGKARCISWSAKWGISNSDLTVEFHESEG